ncbi:UDP-N-acetylmuramoyl-L-alanine--D-glutamate ligase [Pseudoalteromonas denitrificans]|uniref:UDP-N-acetylmuramoylalanine--D-glutamate ligase n=1 Tax=Pseudoalteromonas denitrificans DSM 6059 TaxID=1123010 RepID=A0A1I1QM32_9GAMM|nr:UDP-N-acetylmuramoyl-L-alanine--D-glutamate ligase [Pseudoalteromonas denitrificans]SFD23184.1 UDP-N-acetylmuramoylalanine--D-glutamate ligase [Pseudoalteromonas denitrificans DSM 6059]
MTYLAQLKNKNIIVLGLGISGLSTVRFLLQNDIKPKVVDSRLNAPGKDWLQMNAPELEVYFGQLSHADLSQADIIIISPGIALAEQEVAFAISEGTDVIGDIELFARINDKPVIAVTGSNGKSSVVTLAAQVLEKAGFRTGLGGNIGTPVLDLLNQNIDVFVLELSSFQLETTTSLKPVSATILNISEDHLDRYLGMAEYTQAKHQIYKNCQYAIYNKNDLKTYPNQVKNKLSFGVENADFCLTIQENKSYFNAIDKPMFDTSNLLVEGKHNQLNALAVIALLAPWKLSIDIFKTVFNNFKGLEHRCQLVTTIADVKYFNDSKATNVGACIASIKSLAETVTAKVGKNIILIAGGDAKGADLSVLKSDLEQYVKQLICLGKDARKISLLFNHSNEVETMEQAVELAHKHALPGDIVLLAPACSSLDMYANFMARGNDFTQLILNKKACL